MFGLLQRKLSPGASFGSGRLASNKVDGRSEGQLIGFKDAFPWDVMALILDRAVQVYHDGTNPKFIGSPFLLSGVCKDWQSYINSHPRFWTSVIISLHKSRRWHNDYTLGLQGWVKRAEDLPLDIYLDAHVGHGLRHDTDYNICLIMAETCSQWRSLDTSPVDASFRDSFCICVEETSRRRVKAGLPPLNYPLLRSYVVRGLPSLLSVSLLTQLGRIPYLRTLKLDHYDKYSLILTTNTITNVTITTFSVVPAHEVLFSFPQVEAMDIRYLTFDPARHFHDGKRVTSTRLRSIKLTTETVVDIMHLLRRLQTPNLEDLCLHSRDVVHHGNIPDSVLYSVYAMGCHLKRLSLQLVIVDDAPLIRMLWAIPSLEELDLCHLEPHRPLKSFKGVTQIFFGELYPESGPNYLPKLQTLAYEGPLAIDSLSSLEPLVLRMDSHQNFVLPPILDSPIPESLTNPQPRPPAGRLKFAKIVTDQKWPLFGAVPIISGPTPSKLVNAQTPQPSPIPPDLLERIRCLVDRNALWLLNGDGTRWK